VQLNISEITVANGDHNGLIKVHISDYLGPAAQSAIDGLVASNQDISSALLISEPMTIIIEAAKRTSSSDKLKDMIRGFKEALVEWYEQLDELEMNLMTYHANPQKDAYLANSSTHADQFDT